MPLIRNAIPVFLTQALALPHVELGGRGDLVAGIACGVRQHRPHNLCLFDVQVEFGIRCRPGGGAGGGQATAAISAAPTHGQAIGLMGAHISTGIQRRAFAVEQFAAAGARSLGHAFVCDGSGQYDHGQEHQASLHERNPWSACHMHTNIIYFPLTTQGPIDPSPRCVTHPSSNRTQTV